MKSATRKKLTNDFSFQSGNLKLNGTLFYPPRKQAKHPAILFVHGWTGEKKTSFQYAKTLVNLGYICLLFDMRGHGTSEVDRNAFTPKDFLDDVLAAYDYLSSIDEVDTKNISAIGSSFGGYLVALLSAKRKIRNLVLRAPADYPNETFGRERIIFVGNNPKVMTWRNKSRQPKESYALEALHKFKGNVLVIESEKDDRVPHQTIDNYVNAVKNKDKLTHVIMKDAPHSIKEGKFRDEVERILTKWFRKLL